MFAQWKGSWICKSGSRVEPNVQEANGGKMERRDLMGRGLNDRGMTGCRQVDTTDIEYELLGASPRTCTQSIDSRLPSGYSTIAGSH